MAMTEEQIDTTTKAGRVLANGGGGLPEEMIQIAYGYELGCAAIANDPKLSQEYKREEIARLKDQAQAEMRSATGTSANVAVSGAALTGRFQ